MASAVMSRFFRLATWSFIKAIKGDTTMQTPSIQSAGTWKQMDLPPPVGSKANASLPSNTERTMSSCKGLNWSKPQYCLSMSFGLAIVAGWVGFPLGKIAARLEIKKVFKFTPEHLYQF